MPGNVRQYVPVFFVFVACLLRASSAHGWWEATLQRVDIDLELSPDGRGRVTYDIRYHVDRGRFEGLTLQSPDRVLDFDRQACFIEDARGQRYPIRIQRRHRDGAYVIRKARSPGLRRGWVTVTLVHLVDFHQEHLRRDAEGQALLSWGALSWDVGFDRMTITVRLSPAEGRLQPDEVTSGEYEVAVEEGSLVLSRIRPVRWYEAQVAVVLPQGFLQRQPASMDQAAVEPTVEEPEAIQIPAVSAASGGGAHPRLWLAAFAMLAFLGLALKWKAGDAGFRDRQGAPLPLVLPRVPSAVRWGAVLVGLASGAYLQTQPYLAAGTLAFVAAVALSVRGGRPETRAVRATAWCPAERSSLRHVRAEAASSGGARWPLLLDGTSLLGAPVMLAAAVAGAFAVSRLWQATDSMVADALAIDLVVVLGAIFLTGRRRGLLLSAAPGAARVFARLWRPLGRTANAAGSGLRVLVGAERVGGELLEVRLALVPPPKGTTRVEVSVEPGETLAGWTIWPRVEVHAADGSLSVVTARTGWVLCRRLRRLLRESARSES